MSSASLPDSITASSFELLDAKRLKRKLAMFWSAALQRLKDKLKFTVISPASADLGQDGQLVLVCIPLRRRRKINGVCETGSIFRYLGHICCGSAPGVVQGCRISLQRQLAMLALVSLFDAVLSITLRLSGAGLTAL